MFRVRCELIQPSWFCSRSYLLFAPWLQDPSGTSCICKTGFYRSITTGVTTRSALLQNELCRNLAASTLYPACHEAQARSIEAFLSDRKFTLFFVWLFLCSPVNDFACLPCPDDAICANNQVAPAEGQSQLIIASVLSCSIPLNSCVRSVGCP